MLTDITGVNGCNRYVTDVTFPNLGYVNTVGRPWAKYAALPSRLPLGVTAALTTVLAAGGGGPGGENDFPTSENAWMDLFCRHEDWSTMAIRAF